MVYRICGGIGLVLLGLGLAGIASVPDVVTGIFLLIGGLGLLAGF